MALFALTVSCERPTVLPGEFKTISGADWEYGDTVIFNEHSDTIEGIVNALEFTLRHTDDYPYANVWMEVSYRSGNLPVADTFNIKLADEYGKWFGFGSGPVRTVTDTLRLRYLPDQTSRYGLRHIMRVDVLPEIEEIGVKYVTSSHPGMVVVDTISNGASETPITTTQNVQ